MQPVIIQDTITIGAGLTNENVIISNPSLQALQRLPFAAKIGFAAVTSAAGLLLDFDVGSSNFVKSSNVRISTGSPQLPLDVVNDEMYQREGAMLILRATNPTGGNIVLRYMIVAEPVSELRPCQRVMQQGPTTIAAAAVDVQLLDGLMYENPPHDCLLDVLMTSSAAGLLRSVYVETTRVAPPSTISIENRIPQNPFDMTVGSIEVPQDNLIQLMVSNPTGGNLTVNWKTVLQELAVYV